MSDTDEKTAQEYVWALQRPTNETGVKVVGGYKVQDNIFNGKGGVVCPDKSEAERLAELTGWHMRRVSPNEHDVPERPILPKQHREDSQQYSGTPAEAGIHQFIESFEYQGLKSYARKLRENGAPHIDLKSPAADLEKYILQHWEEYAPTG